jgi:hypothetical protein
MPQPEDNTRSEAKASAVRLPSKAQRDELSKNLKQEIARYHLETGHRPVTVTVNFTDDGPEIDSVFLPEDATIGVEDNKLVLRIPLTPPAVDQIESVT